MPITLDGTNGITTPLDVEIQGATSGSIILAAPAVAGTNTQTLVATTGTLAPIVSGTAVTVSGTAVNFNGIPSWVKRITVMLSGVSTNGTSLVQIQFGSTTFATSGYSGSNFAVATGNVTGLTALSSGFTLDGTSAATYVKTGLMTAALLNSATNLWVLNGTITNTDITRGASLSGAITLAGVLDRVRITTVNGTDTFDAGSINILYE